MQLQTVLCDSYDIIFVILIFKSKDFYITEVSATPLPPPQEKFWVCIGMAPFHILSSSQLTNHPITQCCVLLVNP